MRWNGVFILGVGISAIGFAAMASVYFQGSPAGTPEQQMTLAMAVLAGGALTTAIGAFLAHSRRVNGQSHGAGRKRFGGSASQNGAATRIFGRRDTPVAPKPIRRDAPLPKPTFLAIEGPK